MKYDAGQQEKIKKSLESFNEDEFEKSFEGFLSAEGHIKDFETLVVFGKSSLKVRNYEKAFEIGQTLISQKEHRREGYRIRIEAGLRGRHKMAQTFSTIDLAHSRNVMDEDMLMSHLWQGVDQFLAAKDYENLKAILGKVADIKGRAGLVSLLCERFSLWDVGGTDNKSALHIARYVFEQASYQEKRSVAVSLMKAAKGGYSWLSDKDFKEDFLAVLEPEDFIKSCSNYKDLFFIARRYETFGYTDYIIDILCSLTPESLPKDMADWSWALDILLDSRAGLKTSALILSNLQSSVPDEMKKITHYRERLFKKYEEEGLYELIFPVLIGKIKERPDQIENWRRAAANAGSIACPHTAKKYLAELKELALKQGTSYAHIFGLVLFLFAQKKGPNSLSLSVEKEAAIDLLYVALYEDWKRADVLTSLFSLLLGLARYTDCEVLLDKARDQRGEDQLYWICQSRLNAAKGAFENGLFASEKALNLKETGAAFKRKAMSHVILSDYVSALTTYQYGSVCFPQDTSLVETAKTLAYEIQSGRAYPMSPSGYILPDEVDYIDLTCGEMPALQGREQKAHSKNWLFFSRSGKMDASLNSVFLECPDGCAYSYGGACDASFGKARAHFKQAKWLLVRRSDFDKFIQQAGRSSSLLEDLYNFAEAHKGYYFFGSGEDASKIERVFPSYLCESQENRPAVSGARKVWMSPGLCKNASIQKCVKDLGASITEELSPGRQTILVGFDEVHLIGEAVRTQSSLILVGKKGCRHGWQADPDRADKLGEALKCAAAIILTDLADEEALEDDFKVATFVHKTVTEGLKAAFAFAANPVCVAVGAGIGNILFTTPLIRYLSEFYGQPVDVVMHSPVPPACQLMGESKYVNMAYTVDNPKNITYKAAFVTSSFGNIPFALASEKTVSQRPAFDFSTETRSLNEARYNFKGLERLTGEPVDVDALDIENKAFVRGYSADQRKGLDTKALPIGISGPQKAEVWGRRQWPYYKKLVDQLVVRGDAVHSFGLPDEHIEGTTNKTSDSLRQSIRYMTQCGRFVSSDGGVFHIADALGLDTIVLFGPTSAVKNGPMNKTSRIVTSAKSCSPCQFNSQFSECGFAACMSEISVGQVLAVLDSDGSNRGDFDESLKRLPFGHDMFTGPESAEAFTGLDTDKNYWSDAFTIHFGLGDLARAERLVDWRISRYPQDELAWINKAKVALKRQDFSDCVQICSRWQENGDKKLEWLRLVSEAFYQMGEAQKLLDLYENSEFRVFSPDYAKGSWCGFMWQVTRVQLALGQDDAAYANLCEIVAVDPNYAPVVKALKHFRWDIFANPKTRAPILDPEKKSILVVNESGRVPDYLKPFRSKLEIYTKKGRPTEKDAAQYDLVIQAEDVAPSAFMPELVNGAPRVDPSDYVEKIKKLIGFAEIKNDKRILVAAHHHLDGDNPRGGERSTHHIVQRLQREGYDILVVVENKKTDDLYTELKNGVKYVVSGRYAYAKTLQSVIDCWMPDFALAYGVSFLRGFETLKRNNIPYVFFTRDWQDVSFISPYMKMGMRAAVADVSDPFVRLYRGSYKVVGNSASVSRVVDQMFNIQSIVSYVPVRKPENASCYHPEGPILLINPRKMNGGPLIRQIAEKLPEKSFRVIGEDGMAFPDNVEVLPFHNGPFQEMYRGVSLFLFPFIGEDPCGTGRVIFEALHCGIPSISNDIGCMTEVLPKEWRIQDHTVENWCGKITDMFGKSDLSEACADLVAPFDSEEQMGRITEIVEGFFKAN